MILQISTERIFNLSCFEGFRLIRLYALKHPNIEIDVLLELIKEVEADGASLDFEAAVHLHGLIENECPLEGVSFYQTCIKAVLIKYQPMWSKTMKQGRKRFAKSLNQDEKDLFGAAGLLDDTPSEDVVMWWDQVSSRARLSNEQSKLEQGRTAEILTLNYERERLKSIGIDEKPSWPGLDDNFAGYDVLSFDHSTEGITHQMIEVKSSTLSPQRFYITRHEWKQAERVGDKYIFHIWNMSSNPPRLNIRTVKDVKDHIPSDNGKGVWSTAEIPVN